jgi:hypothetical protein
MLKINELSNPKRTPSRKYTFAESVKCKVIERDFNLSVNEINLKKYITNRMVSESSNNKEGFFKKIWNAIKKFFQWIGTFFNNIWRRIKIFIKKLIRKFRRKKKEKDNFDVKVNKMETPFNKEFFDKAFDEKLKKDKEAYGFKEKSEKDKEKEKIDEGLTEIRTYRRETIDSPEKLVAKDDFINESPKVIHKRLELRGNTNGDIDEMENEMRKLLSSDAGNKLKIYVQSFKGPFYSITELLKNSLRKIDMKVDQAKVGEEGLRKLYKDIESLRDIAKKYGTEVKHLNRIHDHLDNTVHKINKNMSYFTRDMVSEFLDKINISDALMFGINYINDFKKIGMEFYSLNQDNITLGVSEVKKHWDYLGEAVAIFSKLQPLIQATAIFLQLDMNMLLPLVSQETFDKVTKSFQLI